MRRTVLIPLAAGLLAAAGTVLAVPSASAADTGTVTVVHGIPGVDVDVYVDGKEALPDFKPGTVTDPIKLPAGDRKVEIFKVGEGPSGTAVITETVTLPAGANASVVAYLDADGEVSPKLGVFVNDTSKIAAGKGRVTVRHVAAAPAVSVSADGATLIETLSNPDEATATVDAKTYEVAVTPASGGDAVFTGPVPVAAGETTIVYAYGSLADSTFAVATQSVTGLAAAPTSVPAGGGSLAGGATGLPLWSLLLMAAAGVVALTSAGRLARTRSRS